MRIVKRRILSAIAVVSAVLCSGTAGLWVLTYREPAGFSIARWRRYYVESFHGTVHIGADRRFVYRGSDAMALALGNHGIARYVPEPFSTCWCIVHPLLRLGFGPQDWFGHRQAACSRTEADVSEMIRTDVWFFPHWVLLPAPLAVIAMAAVGTLRRRQLPAHACQSCGYDLRATPDRCPECGAVPKATGADKLTPADRSGN